MVNQFLSVQLSDKLIRDIANPQISGLDKQSLMGALTPGVTEFQKHYRLFYQDHYHYLN